MIRSFSQDNNVNAMLIDREKDKEAYSVSDLKYKYIFYIV